MTEYPGIIVSGPASGAERERLAPACSQSRTTDTNSVSFAVRGLNQLPPPPHDD